MLVLATLDVAAGAGLKHSMEERDYRVWGTSAAELVDYMDSQPFAGDNHPTIASIRPRYDLSIETRKGPGGCRVASASLNVRFVMTLPRAVEADKLSKRTRSDFNSLRGFLKRHELTHRSYYLTCARRFLSKVRRLRADGSCWSLEWEAERLLDKENAACDRLHRAFDRREAGPLWNLPLFRHAKAEARRNRSKYRRFVADP